MVYAILPRDYIHGQDEEELQLFFKEITSLELTNPKTAIAPKKGILFQLEFLIFYVGNKLYGC